MFAHVTIDNIDCQKQSLWEKFEIIMDLNHPINERRSNGLVNFELLAHVQGVSIPFLFHFYHICLNVIAKFSNVVDIAQSLAINSMQMIEDLIFAPLIKHL